LSGDGIKDDIGFVYGVDICGGGDINWEFDIG